MQINSQSRYH